MVRHWSLELELCRQEQNRYSYSAMWDTTSLAKYGNLRILSAFLRWYQLAEESRQCTHSSRKGFVFMFWQFNWRWKECMYLQRPLIGCEYVAVDNSIFGGWYGVGTRRTIIQTSKPWIRYPMGQPLCYLDDRVANRPNLRILPGRFDMMDISQAAIDMKM